MNFNKSFVAAFMVAWIGAALLLVLHFMLGFIQGGGVAWWVFLIEAVVYGILGFVSANSVRRKLNRSETRGTGLLAGILAAGLKWLVFLLVFLIAKISLVGGGWYSVFVLLYFVGDMFLAGILGLVGSGLTLRALGTKGDQYYF